MDATRSAAGDDDRPAPPETQPGPRQGRPSGRLRRSLERLSSSAVVERARENLTDPVQVLAIVLIAAFAVRIAFLDLPHGSLIFDEAYYVNAARKILGWAVPEGAHYYDAVAGLDPNQEHPPLGKVLMALSMLVFGDNGLGWRLPSLIAGMAALVAVYLIVRAAGETRWLGVLAVGLLAVDNLALVHSRIGTLDMMVLAPILLAAWMSLKGRWLAAGVLVGIGMLFKLTALYGLLALLVWAALMLLLEWRERMKVRLRDFRPFVSLLVAFVLVTIGGLWLLGMRFSAQPGPIAHLQHMISYGANLKSSAGEPGSCPGIDSTPWQWVVNDCEINYLRVNVTVSAGDKIIAQRATIDFRGALNPFLIGAMPLGFLFAAWYAVRRGSRLAGWSLVWAGANWLPYVFLVAVSGRVTYLYYFLPVVPAIAVAVALLLRRSGLPRAVTWGFVVVYLLGFLAYFPFRQLP
jgi:4-amino-4-deoxy-L-arabinose transferase-like glycosyltransferase